MEKLLKMENPNTEIFRSRIDTFVLNAINQHDGYGYDILDYISNQTDGHYEIKQSSIYNILKRLEKNGYVASYQGDETKGGKRKYYKILDKGKDFLEKEKKEWEYSRTLIDNLVSEKEFDLLNEAPPFDASKLRPLTARKKEDDELEEIDDTDLNINVKDNSSNGEIVFDEDNFYETNDAIKITNDNEILKSEITADIAKTQAKVVSTAAINEKPSINENLDKDISKLEANQKNTYNYNDANNNNSQKFTTNTSSTNNSENIILKNAQNNNQIPYSDNELIFDKQHVKAIENNLYNQYNIKSDYSLKNAKLDNNNNNNNNVDNNERNANTDYNKWDYSYKTNTHKLFNDDAEPDESYKAVFDDIFNNKKAVADEFDEETAVNCKHISDLKEVLGVEGYSLNKYKSTPSKNYMRYLYINKLYRDTSLLSYLFFVLMLLTLFLAKSAFNPNNTLLLVFGCVGIVIPIIMFVNYMFNPKKRKKDNIKINMVLASGIFIYIIFLLLNIIIVLLIPNGYSLNSPPLYAPSIAALVIPFSTILFTVLYKSGGYFQKIK